MKRKVAPRDRIVRISLIGSSTLLYVLAVFPACGAALPFTSTKTNATRLAGSILEPKTGPLSARDIGERILALIENIHHREDISPEIIEKSTGLRVRINPDNENDYEASGKLTDVWYYGLTSLSEKPSQKPTGLLFVFNDQTHANPDMSAVCVTFEHYNQALTAAGFTAKRLRNRLDTEDYWNFSREKIGADIVVRGKHDPKDADTCVSMVMIHALS